MSIGYGARWLWSSAKVLGVGYALILISACDSGAASDMPIMDETTTLAQQANLEWLPQLEHEKYEAIEEQFGGFSMTMKEVGYRYVELYWAGQDNNWEYADYQLEHIEEAIEKGIIRRPSHSQSAEGFLSTDISAMQVIIENEDAEQFEEAFAKFGDACNSCHVQEDVPFISITTPDARFMPIGK